MVRAWENVVGVKVAQADEDIDHRRLKPALVEHLMVEPEQPQPLNRIDGVQRALQRQVRVQLLQHQDRLIDQQLSLAHRQGSDGATGDGARGHTGGDSPRQRRRRPALGGRLIRARRRQLIPDVAEWLELTGRSFDLVQHLLRRHRRTLCRRTRNGRICLARRCDLGVLSLCHIASDAALVRIVVAAEGRAVDQRTADRSPRVNRPRVEGLRPIWELYL